jgi:hypothetical protein
MPVTFSSAVSATSPVIVDVNASQPLGGSTQGLGLIPADEASIGGSRIGSAPGTDFKGEVGDGVGV